MQRAIVKDLGLWTWLIILRWEFEQASAVDSVDRASTSCTPDTYNIVGFYYISVLTHTISTRDSSVSFCAIMGRSGSFCYNSRGKCGKVRILKLHFGRHPGTFLGPLHIFWKHLNIGSNCWPPTASSARIEIFYPSFLFLLFGSFSLLEGTFVTKYPFWIAKYKLALHMLLFLKPLSFSSSICK